MLCLYTSRFERRFELTRTSARSPPQMFLLFSRSGSHQSFAKSQNTRYADLKISFSIIMFFRASVWVAKLFIFAF